jgi:hypothetical protein
MPPLSERGMLQLDVKTQYKTRQNRAEFGFF